MSTAPSVQQFDFSVDILRALLWRHNEAVNLTSLLEQKQAWYDLNHTGFWNDWYNNVFNLYTANDFGCAVWSFVLGVPLGVIIPPDYLTKPVFGFGPYRKNFSGSNFANRSQNIIPLTTPQKRLVLLLRWAQLTSKGASVTKTNQIISYIFTKLGYGSVYVLDGLNMTAEYIFTFAIPSAVLFVLSSYDILPRPDGVKLTIRSSVRATFGFGLYHKNFNNGTFGA